MIEFGLLDQNGNGLIIRRDV